MNILIIGAGEIGRAINFILKDKAGAEISLWDKNPEKIPGQKPPMASLAEGGPLSESAGQAGFVFICVPSRAYVEVVRQIKPVLKKEAIVVSLTKGLDLSEKSTGEILSEELKERPSGLLAGPMLAEEIIQGKKSFAVFASKNKENFEKISELFKDTNLSVLYSDDVLGTSLCSVLKNIYAVLFGVLDGLNLGGDTKGELIVKVINEMMAIVSESGGKKESALGLAGLGDFLATATSKYSKNYAAGLEIAKTKALSFSSEGTVSLPILKNRLEEKMPQFPLLEITDKILKNPKDVEELIKGVL